MPITFEENVIETCGFHRCIELCGGRDTMG